jgi:uncharacterized protein YoxC
MKRLIVLVVAVAAMFALVPVVASATSSPTLTQFRALQRQVNRLQGQVNGLQTDVRNLNGDVNSLWNDVFGCTFPGDPLVSFSDGSFGYVLYYDYLCTSTAKPNQPGRQPATRAG